jgi:large subunit ribosomal protein L9
VAADEAVIMAAQLKKVTLKLKVHTGEDGRIFGSVTSKDISEAAEEQYGFQLDKKNIKLKEPIKTAGNYEIEVWVHPKVTSTIHLVVTAE